MRTTTPFGYSRRKAVVPVEYERCLNRYVSVVGVAEPIVATGFGGGEFMLGLGLGARAYAYGNAPQGPWVGVQLEVLARLLTIATGRLEAGYSILFANSVVLSFGAGLGWSYSNVSGTLSSYLPAFGLRGALGYAL